MPIGGKLDFQPVNLSFCLSEQLMGISPCLPFLSSSAALFMADRMEEIDCSTQFKVFVAKLYLYLVSHGGI